MDVNETYVVILRDSLINKKKILEKLEALTNEQYELVVKGDIEADEFDRLIEEKGKNLAMLDMIDEGFENMYIKVKDEINARPDKYESMLAEIRNLISDVVALGAKIQSLEHRNKDRIEAFIAGKRNEIRDYNIQKNTSKNYYSNMANQHVEGASYFMDSKK